MSEISPEAMEQARQYVRRKRILYTVLGVWIVLCVMWFLIDVRDGGSWWFYWPMLGTGVVVAITGVVFLGMGGVFGAEWERRQIDRYLDHRGTSGTANGAAPRRTPCETVGGDPNRTTSIERISVNRITLVKLFVRNLDEALEFYTEKLGFEVAEDSTLGDYRWLLVRLPGNEEFSVNLDVATTDEQRALVGRQAADAPLFSIETDDCMREYTALKDRGVEFEGEPQARPYGTGALMKDLYGNKIYINQDEPDQSPQTV